MVALWNLIHKQSESRQIRSHQAFFWPPENRPISDKMGRFLPLEFLRTVDLASLQISSRRIQCCLIHGPCGSRSFGSPGMDWVLRGIRAAAPLTPYLLTPRCPDCSCVADCSVDAELVGLLGRQLERCGPEQLTCPVCPGCPELRCPEPGPAYGAFFAGAVCGALAVGAGLLAWRLWTSRPKPAPAPAPVTGQDVPLAIEAPARTAPGEVVPAPVVATPASVRASRR